MLLSPDRGARNVCYLLTSVTVVVRGCCDLPKLFGIEVEVSDHSVAVLWLALWQSASRYIWKPLVLSGSCPLPGSVTSVIGMSGGWRGFIGAQVNNTVSSKKGNSPNGPNSQIPECTCTISHNAPFRTEMCTFLCWMRALWDVDCLE